MIRLELPSLIFVYTLVFLAAVFVVWIAYEMARRIRDARSFQGRLRCALCGMEFEDKTPTDLPRCPRCGSLNERACVKAF